jgi:uncharacterized membrane protein YqiK
MDYIDMQSIIFSAVIIVVAFFTVGMILARLYKRATKELSFVRTGFGGEKVIMDGGALVFPVLHDTILVNMNTVRLEVRRDQNQALITRDRMRVDVVAEFYVRVQPTADSIANAAQTLGARTVQKEELKDLVEGKFVDALRAVAAEMTMKELHEKRIDFVQKVQIAVTEDLLKNGLELESVSLTGLDQTAMEYFNPNNAFDAEGLTRLTEEIETRKKLRNDIEQDTQVQIKAKNLEAELIKLEIDRDSEYAVLKQQREIELRKAAQVSEIAKEQAIKKQEAEQASISAQQQVEQQRIASDKKIEEDRIQKEKIIETQSVDKLKQIELAEQDRAIAIAVKSKSQSEAQAEADKARALAVQAHEQVITARDQEIADREKTIELIEATKQAEKEAIAITISAEADKQAARDRAEAVTIEANANAAKTRIEATGEADAEKEKAVAAEIRYRVEAEGKNAINLAENILSDEQIGMQVKVKLIENLENIIRESVKPMENIDGIKIFQLDGLNQFGGGAGQGTGADQGAGGGSLSDQVVRSALKYRAQAPLLDSLLSEIGLKGGDVHANLGSLLTNGDGSIKSDLGTKTNGIDKEVQS